MIPRLFERLEGARADGLAVEDGRFVTADGWAVIFLATGASAFDSEAQREILAAIGRARATLDADIAVQSSGVNRFAVAAERSIKADIRRISIASVVGLFLLFGFLFRSVRLVALTSLPIGAGMLVGCAACLLAYGRIHGLTLAFGASLIGVCIDYTTHLYCHHVIVGKDGASSVRAIWPGMLLGALTTIAGFVMLGAASFPGLREVALFAATGIGAALLATRYLLPPLLPVAGEPAPPLARLTGALSALLRTLTQHRRALWSLPIAAAVVVAIAAPRVRWDDDVQDMNRLDPALMAEDAAVRARVARLEQQRFVVALGDDIESALIQNDEAARILDAARAAGEVADVRTLNALLPSAKTQAEVAEAMRNDGLWPRFERVFAAEGFVPKVFAPFREALTAPIPPPLTFEALKASPLSVFARAFEVTLGSRIGVLTYLVDVRDPQALAARFEGQPAIALLDQAAVMSSAYRAYRERTTWLLSWGLLAVLALLLLRYRRLRSALAAFVPALLAAAVTIAALALWGRPLSLVALTALLMVLSMGVDYGVFLVEAAAHDEATLPATLVALIAACLSTVFGFGLLALSAHPALSTIGLVAGVGVVASLIFAPTTLVLVKR